MRRAIGAVLALMIGAASSPVLANDLIYRHADGNPDMLERSDGRPYWLLLAECSGFYGALANMAADDAASQAYVDEGMATFNLALARVRADRGLDQAGAVRLMEPYVSRARDVGESSLAGPVTASATEGGLTPELILTSTCRSLRRTYTASVAG